MAIITGGVDILDTDVNPLRTGTEYVGLRVSGCTSTGGNTGRLLTVPVTVVEVTFCNSISVAEHAVMMILSMVRD